MPQVRVKTKTKNRLEKLAEQLVGSPGVETAKHAGMEYVPADQVLSLALEALEESIQAKKGSPKR